MNLNETVGRLATRLILEFRSAEDDMAQFGKLYKAEYGVEAKREKPMIWTVPSTPDRKTALSQVVVLMLGLGYRKGTTYKDGSVDLFKRVWMAKVITPAEDWENQDIIIGWMKAPTVKVPTSGWHPAKQPAKTEV